MTRDEDAIIEAKKYYRNDIKCYDAFLHGVEWAEEQIANVWHDAMEEPQGDEWHIAYIDVFGSIQSLKCPSVTFDTFPSLADFAAGVGMQCWAYISDLLPKGGEQ